MHVRRQVAMDRGERRAAPAPPRQSSAPTASRRRPLALRHRRPSRRQPQPCIRRSAHGSRQPRSRAHGGGAPPHGRHGCPILRTRNNEPRPSPWCVLARLTSDEKGASCRAEARGLAEMRCPGRPRTSTNPGLLYVLPPHASLCNPRSEKASAFPPPPNIRDQLFHPRDFRVSTTVS